MTTETITLTDYTITTTYAYKTSGGTPTRTYYHYYIGQRVVLFFQHNTHSVQAIQVGDTTYYTDDSGRLYLDVTDDLRTAYDRGGAVASEYTGIFGTRTYLMGDYGIDPESILMPLSPMLESGAYNPDLLQIMPPSVIYQQDALGGAYDLQIELRGDYATSADWSGTTESGEDVSLYTSPDPLPNQLTLPHLYNDTADPIVRLSSSDMDAPMNLQMLKDCDNACVLRWISQTGIYKQAIWRVKKIKVKATEVALLPIGDGYKQQRGQLVSFVAYIRGLDAYSAAYYADIITSPDVHAAIRAGEDLTGYQTSVQVGTDSYTIADGDAGDLQTLEITINYKQYDAL